MARWYNVEVTYKEDVRAVRLTGAVPRFANLSTLLDKLEQTGLVKFKTEGRKITVGR
ncbi:hypothetical protein D3C86_2221670 [compost metagenome]